MAKTAIEHADSQTPTNPARTNALLELISDQLMYAALSTPGLGSQLDAKLGAEAGTAYIVLSERIVQNRKRLGLNP